MPCTNTNVSFEILALPVRLRQLILALLGGLLSKRDADPGGEILSINGGRENKVPSKFSRVLPVLRRAKVVRFHHKTKA